MFSPVRAAATAIAVALIGSIFNIAIEAAPAAVPATRAGEVTLLIEAEQFPLRGGWMPEQVGAGCLGGAALKVGGGDALAVIDVPADGLYALWTRSRDFATQQPRSRRFLLLVDDKPADLESGQHGQDGWRWERVGAVALGRGLHLVTLRDTAQFFGRCDAVLLTTGDFDPNDRKLQELAAFRTAPRPTPFTRIDRFPEAPAIVSPGPETARIASDRLRIIFSLAQDAAGGQRIVPSAELKLQDQWVRLPVDLSQERLFLLRADRADTSTARQFPHWPHAVNRAEVHLNSRTYQTTLGFQDPFFAAPAELLIARSVRQVDPATAEILYESPAGPKATVLWQVLPGRTDVQVTASFSAQADGDYSLGYSAFAPVADDDVEFNLLPPLYQYQRRPARPRMVTNSFTPQPLALVQTSPGSLGDHPFTVAVAADPARIPFEWARGDNAVYGFSLQNADMQVQPTIFSPVLGLAGSRLARGESKTVSWRLLFIYGDWKDALEYASATVFGVKDYRQPAGTSLTQAALNMIDLLNNDDAGGWDANLKGLWNIEGPSTVTQASPLAIVSAAILSQDEQMWARRALPTIEYTLSRPSAHFATTVPNTTPAYVNEQSIRLQVPSQFFGTAYWEGLHELLGGANRWIISDIAMPDGKPRHSSSYGAVPEWSELLAAYRLAPSDGRLRQLIAEVDRFLKDDVYGRKTGELGLEPFYNVSFYPYWWDLADLYEITHDKRYIAAAEQCAFNTIAGMRSSPLAPDREVTIYPGGKFEESPHIWWKGANAYRLGIPRWPGATPEHNVPAWVVSPVGLGFEQPSTYWDSEPGHGMRNIMMSCWAPHLLRLYELTGREIYRTYARNAIIGRFGNYPGYYIMGFSDLQLAPDYPCKGPDVTSIYYHHIPPHLAFTIDYLMTEAHLRSRGRIAFPWGKQQGYVWFSNRIYGGRPGRVFDDAQVSLRFDRRLAEVVPDKVDYLIGRGRERLYVILMGQGLSDVAAEVKIDPNRAGILADQPYRVLDARGAQTGARPFASRIVETVPAGGMIVLSFAAGVQQPPLIPPLEGGHIVQKLGGPWGDLHAFRIRSPFARDSLYVVLTGRPAEGACITLELQGQEAGTPRSKRNYPYELSVYPWPMDRDMSFTLLLKDAAGKELRTRPITLKGTRR